MSFSDTIFLFFLALILFGPKKLPEMARQAGRLLAELRRASNEFRSQIETEIAHLEVQNKVQNNVQDKQTVSSAPPPQGTVASLSLNPAASEPTPSPAESSATLASPTAETPAANSNRASLSSSMPPETVDEPSASTSQASHV